MLDQHRGNDRDRGDNQRRRRRRSNQRPMPPRPARRSLHPGVGQRGHGLVGQPVFQIIAQGARRRITLALIEGHRLEANHFQALGDLRSELPRRRGTARSERTARLRRDRPAAIRPTAAPCRSASSRASPRGCRRRWPGRADRAGRRLVRGSCMAACRWPSPSAFRRSAAGRGGLQRPVRPGRSGLALGSPIGFARPQSTTSVSPYLPSMMLPGFRSRCSTPRLWAYSMALHTSMKRPSSLRNSSARSPGLCFAPSPV